MTQASDILTQFNAGELSPLMEGRVDFNKYRAGLRTCENFVPTVQGAAKRRQGSRYVADTKNDGERVWLRPFQASNLEQYVLEFGDEYIRFYTQHGQLESSPGNPYEVATPYTTAELTTDEGVCALQMVQSNDVLFIVHANHAPCKLTRTGVGTFTFTQNALGVSENGPFKDLNADQSILISASGDGTLSPEDTTLTDPIVTLTASTGIFLDGMVGKYFYLQEGNNILVTQWEFNKDTYEGQRRRSDSINYVAMTGTFGSPVKTGNVKPVHLDGMRFDGDTGQQWQFTDDGSGVVLITALVGAQPTNVVTATVIKRLPYSITSGPGGATHRWAAAAWTADDGYPDTVCFFRERTVFGREQTIWMSVAGDFENFSTTVGGQVTADSAIILTLASDKKDRVHWLQPDSQLIAGTASGEYAIGEYSNGQPLGPANVRAARQSAFGSRALKPVAISAANLFLEKGGRRVREMSFDIRQNQYQSVDVTVLAEHITKATGITPSARINDHDGILDWTWAARPDHVLWAARADGVLLGFTYNREQDVTGWHRHKLGNELVGGVGWGQVESVCAIGSPDGTQDDLWLVVNRGGTRHVEWIGQPVQAEIDNTPWGAGGELELPASELASIALWEVDAFYVDSGLSRQPTITHVPATRKQIFLTSGSGWVVPDDWNNEDNTIECIGAGGDGANVVAPNRAGGGGGGAYSKVNNLVLTPGDTIVYAVGGGESYFDGVSLGGASVGAAAGSDASGATAGAGGLASAGVGDLRYDGGTGGIGGSGNNAGHGGGGGAGGPSGPGGTGGKGGNLTQSGGGGGGGANGGTAGAPGTAGTAIALGGEPGGGNGGGVVAGVNGLPGTTVPAYDATHGPGGGGGGGAGNGLQSGGYGGLYGGGGGGGESGSGVGSNGLIVITYTTAVDTVTTVSGLDHLEGKTVQVVTDGSPHPSRVVVGGAIELQWPAFVVHAGLACPAVLETTQIGQQGPDGSAQGKTKRITWVVARLFESKGGRMGSDANHLEQFMYRNAPMIMDSYVPFQTGDERVDWPGGYEGQSRIYILQDSAFPMTVCALVPTFSVSGRPGL